MTRRVAEMGNVREVAQGNCAVFDIGKSFAKLSVVTPGGEILVDRRIATPALRTPLYDAFDTDSLFNWLLTQLKSLSDYRIDRIIPVAHGAACALLDESEALVMPVQDYEAIIPPAVVAAYELSRPPFSETLSPRLPKGMNLGAQLFWHSRRDPALFARVRWILPYAQYWTWRLSGALVSEVSTLGCHTDLWSPATNDFSSLARNEGWAARFPAMRGAWETAGTLRPVIARATGLPEGTRVCVGVHDSNSALAALLSGWHNDEPPAMLSTGTWFIAMAPDGRLDNLQADRDCMGAVDVFGRPVPCARFMGGRAYQTITNGVTEPVDVAMLDAVMREPALALPSFLEAGGPFPHMRGEIRGLRDDTPQARAALGVLYQALLSITCLSMIQSGRALVIEGMAAGNPVLCRLIAALHDGPVVCTASVSAVTLGASALAYRDEVPLPRLRLRQVHPLLAGEFRAYRDLWLQACNTPVAA